LLPSVLCSKKILAFFDSLMLLVGWFLLMALPASADAGGAALLARRICRELSPTPVLFRE
jgi:hypothetical protein